MDKEAWRAVVHGVLKSRTWLSDWSDCYSVTKSCPAQGPLHWWCCPTISSSVTLFSFYLHSFPASGSFQMSCLFASCGQSIGASASVSVLPVSIQDDYLLKFTSLAVGGIGFEIISPADKTHILWLPHPDLPTVVAPRQKESTWWCDDDKVIVHCVLKSWSSKLLTHTVDELAVIHAPTLAFVNQRLSWWWNL